MIDSGFLNTLLACLVRHMSQDEALVKEWMDSRDNEAIPLYTLRYIYLFSLTVSALFFLICAFVMCSILSLVLQLLPPGTISAMFEQGGKTLLGGDPLSFAAAFVGHGSFSHLYCSVVEEMFAVRVLRQLIHHGMSHRVVKTLIRGAKIPYLVNLYPVSLSSTRT